MIYVLPNYFCVVASFRRDIIDICNLLLDPVNVKQYLDKVITFSQFSIEW